MSPVDKKLRLSHRIFVSLFIFILLFLVGFFIWGESHLEGEMAYGLNQYEELKSDWQITYPSGNKAMFFYLPTTRTQLDKFEYVTLSTTLPDNDRYTSIAICNYGQYVNLYVNGELRGSYNESNIHKIGKDVPIGYLFFHLKDSDAGQRIELEFIRPDADSLSCIGSIYVGSEIALIFNLVKNSAFELIVSVFLIFVGLLVTLIGLIIQRKLKTTVPIVYLGIAVALCSLWLICNSTGRQFVFPNISIARNCAFMLVILAPVPFLFFYDSLQRGRYRKIFHACIAACLITFVTNFTLNITGVIGLSELYLIPIGLTMVIIPIVIFTVIRDFWGVNKKDFYRLSAIGSIIFSFCAVLQMISYITHFSEKLNGVFLATGLFIMCGASTYEAVHNFDVLYEQHKEAVTQVEVLSREALETIAKTVDAKDPYTLEHSARVSEYSGLIAERMGWKPDDIESLENAALLHDIGKIGIPDSILNKPAKLTDEEFKVIKSHPTMGAEIVDNISSLKFAHDVALYHHEKYDGTGYPTGLSGADIPESARIVCIADSFDAMNSKRVYRNNLNKDTIKAELIRCRGTQFDPEILDVFLKILEKGEIH